MPVLLTGDMGRIGRWLGPALTEAGLAVVGFDRGRGEDLLDAASVRAAVTECDTVVHAAALAGDTAGSPAEIRAVNVHGTANVLAAAEVADA